MPTDPTKESHTWTGGCACGAVRYEASEAPVFSFHCQCRQCQRATGGGHASAFVVRQDTTTVRGEMTFFERTSDRGNIVSSGFCPICGSPMMNRNAAYPEHLYINAATLDDPGLFRPTAVLFKESAQPWDHIDPDLKAP